MEEAPIVVTHLTRSYGKRRGVIDLDFSVQPGEIFGFLGPNGAGKTTTIRLLMGMLRPGAGRARVFGLDCWSQAPEVKAKIGFLPGEIHLYERMTGSEFLDFFASFRGGHVPRRAELVERFELDVNARIRHLSKGNRQKLAIIQALMHDAPVLILDEPSSGLDPLMQVALIEALRDEQRRGKTLFLSSHMLNEVERVAHRIAIIREGRIVTIQDVDRLRETRERHMEVLLQQPVDAAVFDNLPGVRVLTTHADGLHVDLAVSGNPRELLGALSALPIEDLVYGPPDLESVFLRYYDSDQTAAALAGNDEGEARG
ncbi:MAG: ABC transporter ATP-binding protein [Thermomicrobiales bacterium]|nr:ABC transporter ATP-binding protein [Thermomicrobiales bacterium]